MLRLIPLLAGVFAVANSLGQIINEIHPDNVDWGEGTVVLNDGSQLQGVVRYNDTEGGVVSFESGSRSASWTPRSVMQFDFFDQVKNRQRFFYTLEFDDSRYGRRPTFFEILKDFKRFAVLSKMDAIDIKKKGGYPSSYNNGMYAGAGTGGKIAMSQTETIYFIDADGSLYPYMKVIRTIVDRDLYDRTKLKNKVLDESLIRKYFKEPEYSQMIKYADDNNLDLGVKDDFIKALGYYEQQISIK